jgi:type IV pilus assembly protein PilF
MNTPLGLLCSVLLLLCSLAACVSSPQPQADGRETRVSSEPADPERRARVRLELAGLYFGRGQNTTALDEIKLALAARPDMPEAFSLRGLVFAAMGDASRADESFQRALQLAPADANTMHNYAWFQCQQGRHAEADLQFSKALAQPQYRDGVRTLMAQGVCQARAGRWPEAERTLSRSYELDPSNPVTAYNLAEVLLRRGELERARFYVRRINSVPEQATAQSLWLAARVERRIGNIDAMQDLGRQLRDRFAQSSEALLYERGRFDD